MLTRRAKIYSSSYSKLSVYFSSYFVAVYFWNVRCSRRLQKSIKKTFYFGSLGSFKVIDVDTTEKLVSSASCDK